MAFRDEMPSVAYIHCPRCGSECVGIPLEWTVQAEQGHQNSILFKTTVKTNPVRHECSGGDA